jgi:FAD/FMN-containing dehydrogenase/Fe-S oxidoreductase
MLYSQDASLYQERPLGVVRPRDANDLVSLARFSEAHGIPLIPRAGGTSLAGQCVGAGLIVDVSRHMNRLLRLDAQRREADVEPGVIQDDLNDAAAPYGLCFAPDTSTSRQAAIGGMIGNNSCGAFSILHGSTRDHVLALDVVLADGSPVHLGPLSDAELEAKRRLNTLEGRIYRGIAELLSSHRQAILADFPKPAVRRRNMGYALDELARRQPWQADGAPFSLVPLICGSEGTLALIAGATVRLVPRPRARRLVCAHFADVDAAAAAVGVVLEERPAAVELMDGTLLEATRHNREQARNRFWVEGAPGAVLAIEIHAEEEREAEARATELAGRLRAAGHGYAWPILGERDLPQVWALRKAGLGLLTGIPGDLKPVTAIEDTAVAVEDLPAYLRDIRALLSRHDCECVFYGHASVGVIHLRPMLNLRDAGDLEKFTRILEETADLVRRYGGSLSGEHGDGRLRSAYLSRMFSPGVYALLERIKGLFDPHGLLNPRKIVRPVSPVEALRVGPGTPLVEPKTMFDWSRTKGFVRAVEACNGSAFCRQGAGRGGMCPAFMATGEEAATTRARANVLRQWFHGPAPERTWTAPEVWAVLDTCVSCKACATECPSSVDMARIKAEVLHRRIRRRGASPRDALFAFYALGARLACVAPSQASWLTNRRWVKRMLGIAPERTLPPFAARTFSSWFRRRAHPAIASARGEVALFVDEFTEYMEPEVGAAALEVIEAFGWRVRPVIGLESGRSHISKGFLRTARRHMTAAVRRLAVEARGGRLIVGLEPSALLGLRDEAPDLVRREYRADAEAVRAAARLFPEWVAERAAEGDAAGVVFGPLPAPTMLVHGHCHQKAIGKPNVLRVALELIPGLRIEELPTACCGMAGAFGYEREHYALSMRMGEQVLFPALRRRPDALVCADGLSCRHQIADGTGRRARHSAAWLRDALRAAATSSDRD